MIATIRTKVNAFVAAVAVAVSLVSTLLYIAAEKKSIEKELFVRGAALSESLSRALDEGMAAEDLNLIKNVEDIVHTKDIELVQVFSSLWLGIASVPADRLNLPPDPSAVAYLKNAKDETEHYYVRGAGWIDIYAPVIYDPKAAGTSTILVGFVRLRITTANVQTLIRRTVIMNLATAAVLTLVAVVVLNGLIGRYVLRPLLTLHAAIARHREGELPAHVPVTSRDEIGELSAEFNAMAQALREREERLADEKERLSVTLRSIGDGVIVTDLSGAVTLINRVAEQHTGWLSGEAVGRQLSAVFHIINEKTRQRCANPIEQVLETGLVAALSNHTVLVRKDGSEIVIEDSAAPIRDRNSAIVGVVLVFRDVTDKKRLEDELLKVEKLESVGLLAGGLAHDFNNLLTSIVGNISIARMHVGPGGIVSKRLEEAEKASRRAADVTYQLLTFSKGGAPVKKVCDVADILRESASFTLAGTAIAPEFHLAPDLRPVEVDPGQFSQVFNNLIINAVQAMPHGGRIVFSVDNAVIGPNEVPPLLPGVYVRVSIADTGTGIPPEHLDRIFDPYFTTKQKGSGLGLSSVFSVVSRHDGHITVESVPARGTTFRLYIPAAEAAGVVSGADDGSLCPGSGRVLVMDDEEIVKDVCGEMLRALGYEPEFAEDGAQACDLYQRAIAVHRPFDAVIMDLTIPGGMGGREGIERLRAIDPNVRAIVSSGYSNDPIMAEYAKYGFRAVITKPYNIVNLSRVLQDVAGG